MVIWIKYIAAPKLWLLWIALPEVAKASAALSLPGAVTTKKLANVQAGNTKGGSTTVPLTSCLTGLESAAWQLTIFCFYLQNRLIQTSQTGGQQYSDTSLISIPWYKSLSAKKVSYHCPCSPFHYNAEEKNRDKFLLQVGQ
jgi:hypothetical protein